MVDLTASRGGETRVWAETSPKERLVRGGHDSGGERGEKDGRTVGEKRETVKRSLTACYHRRLSDFTAPHLFSLSCKKKKRKSESLRMFSGTFIGSQAENKPLKLHFQYIFFFFTLSFFFSCTQFISVQGLRWCHCSMCRQKHSHMLAWFTTNPDALNSVVFSLTRISLTWLSPKS